MKKYLLLLVIGIKLVVNVHAQSSTNQQLSCADCTPEILDHINFVNKDCKESLTDELIARYAAFEKQVEVVLASSDQAELCPLLSSVYLKNKCNSDVSLENAEIFNPEAFNPLKYGFNFYAKIDLYYRVDGTNYVVHIKPAA